jgi:hypothetical protein
VTNINNLDTTTGVYGDFREYGSAEHFPRHPDPASNWGHVSPSHIRTALRNWERAHGLPVWFRDGQLAFSARAWQGLTWAISDIVQNLRGSGFRLPDDLRQWNG